ncbi:MAG: hypothetical protein IKG18_11915 [Atopobiaceae bacterium]|nr:hypothetical protein [Atopobiaceae bacterium]
MSDTVAENVVGRSYEQALAAWVQYLADVRLSSLLEALRSQDLKLETALEQLDICKRRIIEEVIENGAGLGGPHGGKGFIAERLDVYIENARAAIRGASMDFELPSTNTYFDNNGPIDYTNAGIPIQQKFVLRRFSVDAIRDHLDTYPDFIEQGGRYRIPSDFYEELKAIASVPESDLHTLTIARRNIWVELKKLEARGVTLDKMVEPAKIKYMEAYPENYDATLNKERDSIRETDRAERERLKEEHKPGVKEAAQAVALSALLEGGTALVFGVYRKVKSGKKIADFTADDWKDVGLGTAAGTAKGAVRGGVVFLAANYTPVPGAAATAMVTATYGIIAQANQLKRGKITKDEFLVNSEVLCSEVAISAVSAAVGQAVIPVPVLGALVGSAVGSLMYDIAKNNLDSSTQQLVRSFQDEVKANAERFSEEMRAVLASYETTLAQYCTLVDQVLDADKRLAFSASARLALMVGVSEEEVLATEESIDSYFLD